MKSQVSESTNSEQINRMKAVQRVTVIGMVGNLALAVGKFIVGTLGGSQALVADGVHSLSDMTTDVAVIFGAPFWSAPADEDHQHGHGRIETFVTLLIGVALAGVGIGLTYHALATLTSGEKVQPGWLAFWMACISIVSKESLYQWTVRVGMRVKSSAVMANAWHHRSDGLSSLPVAFAVLASRWKPEWTFLDHVATVIVAVLILQASWKIAWPSLQQLLDVSASKEELAQIKQIVLATEGVCSMHAIRSRHIGPGLQIDLHIQVDPDLSVKKGHDIASDAKYRLLKQGPDIVDVLVHLEPYDPKVHGKRLN